MKNDLRQMEILRLHKKWADGYTVIWQVLVVVVFGAIYLMCEQFGVSPVERASSFILLAVVILVVTIWQAAGLAVARIHMLLENIDLETRGRSKSDTGPGN